MPWDRYNAAGTRLVASSSSSANPPCVRANRTATQSLNDATLTPIQFSAADDYDTDTMHDPAVDNTKVTFLTAGVYAIVGQIGYDTNTTGQRYAAIDVNGGATYPGFNTVQAVSNGATVVQVALQFKFAANDYIELIGFQNSTVALNVTDSHLMAVRVATG